MILSVQGYGVYIKKVKGDLFYIDCEPNDTVKAIKEKIQYRKGIPVDKQRLSFTDKILEDHRILSDYSINTNSTLIFSVQGFGIYIKLLTGKFFDIDCEPNDTVKAIKEKIQDQGGIPVDQQGLILNGKELDNHCILSDYPTYTNSVVHILLRLKGGGNSYIYVNTPDGKSIRIVIESWSLSLHELKCLIESETQILASEQKLIYNSKELIGDLLTVNDLRINHEANLFLVYSTKKVGNQNEDFKLFDQAILDPKYDYDFTSIVDLNRKFMRGGNEYKRPCGWKRIALKVKGKYENDIWLGKHNGEGEWPVAYHGSNFKGVYGICLKGFDMNKWKREKYGQAHYTTPDINIAESYAKKVSINGQQIKFVIQSRVNPENILIRKDGKYWLLPNDNDLRPYGLCFKLFYEENDFLINL